MAEFGRRDADGGGSGGERHGKPGGRAGDRFTGRQPARDGKPKPRSGGDWKRRTGDRNERTDRHRAQRHGDRPAYDRDHRARHGARQERAEAATAEEQSSQPAVQAPDLPEEAQYSALDIDARSGLRSVPKSLAELIGRHLVAAGMLVDEDPERALAHARYARARASRLPVVREAAGLAAYHAGEWAEALSELRAVRRMTGGNTHVAVMADCERALGRPERALELARDAGGDLPKEVAVELRIVAAGARRDMGQLDAAVVALQGPDLDPRRRERWSARLFYAYADNLVAAGRTDEAIRWFLNAAEADVEEETDADERAVELSSSRDQATPEQREPEAMERGDVDLRRE